MEFFWKMNWPIRGGLMNLCRETLEICLYKISIGDAILGGLEFMSVSLDRLKKFITVPVLLNNFRQKRNSN